MPIDNLSDRLNAMQSYWQDANPEDTNKTVWPPDGNYSAVVNGFDFFESKIGVAFLKTELKITNDDAYLGKTVETVHHLEDPDRIAWTKKHLLVLGADVEDLATLQDHLSALLDVPVEITIKTSDKRDRDGNPYRNVYVNRRLGDPFGGETTITDAFIKAPQPDPNNSANFGDESPF